MDVYIALASGFLLLWLGYLKGKIAEEKKREYWTRIILISYFVLLATLLVCELFVLKANTDTDQRHLDEQRQRLKELEKKLSDLSNEKALPKEVESPVSTNQELLERTKEQVSNTETRLKESREKLNKFLPKANLEYKKELYEKFNSTPQQQRVGGYTLRVVNSPLKANALDLHSSLIEDFKLKMKVDSTTKEICYTGLSLDFARLIEGEFTKIGEVTTIQAQAVP